MLISIDFLVHSSNMSHLSLGCINLAQLREHHRRELLKCLSNIPGSKVHFSMLPFQSTSLIFVVDNKQTFIKSSQ